MSSHTFICQRRNFGSKIKGNSLIRLPTALLRVVQKLFRRPGCIWKFAWTTGCTYRTSDLRQSRSRGRRFYFPLDRGSHNRLKDSNSKVTSRNIQFNFLRLDNTSIGILPSRSYISHIPTTPHQKSKIHTPYQPGDRRMPPAHLGPDSPFEDDRTSKAC
jgi:hypothetical protein